LALSNRTCCGTPPKNSNASRRQAHSVAASSPAVNRTKVARLKPSVATNASNASRPRRTTVKSACICTPGAVSNRITGSGALCFSGAMNAFSWLIPPS
jgi:hypothetical protein